MDIPENYWFTENHEWVFQEGKEAKIGISEYAQEELGDIVFVELPEIGETLKQFKELGVVESVKAVSDVFAPVSGEVIEINETVIDSPQLVNDSPYNEGWLVKVKIQDESELKDLMDHSEYETFLEEAE